MKKLSNIALILGLLFFVGSITSCTASRRSGAAKVKKKRKKNCDCPKWTDTDKQIPQDEIVAFEDVL